MSIIEIYRKVFKVDKIQVIVGFRAMNIMNDFPEFEYILNEMAKQLVKTFQFFHHLMNIHLLLYHLILFLILIKVKN